MKKIVLLIITAMAVATAWAQDTARYLPAFEAGQRWNEARIRSILSETVICYMDSLTTVVDSNEYCTFQMDNRLAGYTHLFPSYDYDERIYLRQSKDNSKVYFKSPRDSEEYCVYNLDLHVGDTFCSIMRSAPVPLIVDSVYWLDGRKHVRFTPRLAAIDTANHFLPEVKNLPLEFIEGMGPSWGWMWLMTDGDHHGPNYPRAVIHAAAWSVMLCVYRDEVQVNSDFTEPFEHHLYDLLPNTNIPFANCVLDPGEEFGGIKHPSRDVYTVFPNPASSMVSVKGLTGRLATVEVYDMTGRLILRGQALASNPTIDLTALQGQMLLIRIMTDEACSTQKILKL